MSNGFEITWEAGASAQLEIFSPQALSGADTYRLKYTPPFRACLRPPVQELRLGSDELDPMRARLDSLVGAVDARRADTNGTAKSSPRVVEEAAQVGGMLLDLVVPSHIQAEFRVSDLFLEIGIDEKLVEFPWELMYDGNDFLCLRHDFGRFVNTQVPARNTITSTQRSDDRIGGQLNILLISVPQPQPRMEKDKERKYRPLTAAEAETKEIIELIDSSNGGISVTVLKGKDATVDNVYKAIKSRRHHIVHFTGHGFFDPKDPRRSALVLFDRDFTTGQLFNYFNAKPPVFFFMNACETAREQPSAEWKEHYDIFSLARACLETGAYLIGNRWEVGDSAAAAFAKAFYSTLKRGGALGRAVREGRLACRKADDPSDFSWASYIFYGDPRLCFRRLTTGVAGASTPVMSAPQPDGDLPSTSTK